MKIFLITLLTSFRALAGDLFVEEPLQCIEKKIFPCGVRALKSFRMEKSAQVFHFGEGTTLVWTSENQVQILAGNLWAEKTENLQIKHTAHAVFRVNGEFFFSKQLERLEVYNLNGNISFPKKGFFSNEALASGFQNWFSGQMQNEKFSRGLMKPIQFKEFAKLWNQVGSLPKEARITHLRSYAELWKDNVEEASQFYQSVVQRRIASIAEAKAQAVERVMNAEQERLQLLKLYRERNQLLE